MQHWYYAYIKVSLNFLKILQIQRITQPDDTCPNYKESPKSGDMSI